MSPVDARAIWEAMAASDFPFALIDPSTHQFVDANEHYAALLGLEVADIKGLSVLRLYPQEVAESVKWLDRAFVCGALEVIRGQGPLQKLNGQVIELKGWARRIEERSGRRLVVTSATPNGSNMLADDRVWVALAPHVFGASPVDLTTSRQSAPGRAEQLEQHLLRIGLELRAAGLLDAATEQRNAELASRLDELSQRQREIVSRLLAGDRVPEIAKALYLSPSTVRNHLTAVFRRFRVHSQVELIALLKDPNQPAI